MPFPCLLMNQKGNFPKSTFPPERIIPTFLPANLSLFASRAAKGTEQDGSITIFIRS